MVRRAPRLPVSLPARRRYASYITGFYHFFALEAGSNGKVQTSSLPSFKISSIKWSEFKHMRPFHKLGWLPGSPELQSGRCILPDPRAPALGYVGSAGWGWHCGVGSTEGAEGTAGLQSCTAVWGALWGGGQCRGSPWHPRIGGVFSAPETGAASPTLFPWAQKHHSLSTISFR